MYELTVYGGANIERTTDTFDTKEAAIKEANSRATGNWTEWEEKSDSLVKVDYNHSDKQENLVIMRVSPVEDTLEKAIERVTDEQWDAVEEYLGGEVGAGNYLVGVIVQETNGEYAPDEVAEALDDHLGVGTYKVRYEGIGEHTFEVQADGPLEAFEKARDEIPASLRHRAGIEGEVRATSEEEWQWVGADVDVTHSISDKREEPWLA